MKLFIDRINGLYVVWLLGLSAVAFVEPRTMLWFDQRWILWSLAVSMLGMGLSLAPDDFRAAAFTSARRTSPYGPAAAREAISPGMPSSTASRFSCGSRTGRSTTIIWPSNR